MTARSKRPTPPDMLLLAERKRKMASPEPRPGLDADAILASDEDEFVDDNLLDEDQLVEVPAASGQGASRRSGNERLLQRPVDQVSLAQVGWSGPIDHDMLQAALRCYPTYLEPEDRAIFGAAPFPTPVSVGAPALETALRADDIAVSRALWSEQRSGSAERRAEASLLLAASLPDRIAGMDAGALAVVSPVLSAYRNASLEYAWHAYLGAGPNPQLHRERDETAVALLSTLRALLGER